MIRELTLIQLKESFGDCPAAKTAVNSNIRKLLKTIRYNEFAQEELKYQGYDKWTRQFLCMLFDYEPGGIYSEEYKQLKKLKMFKKMISNNPKNNNGISQEDIEQARNIPILEIYQFVKIKRSGRRTWVSCPFHGLDKNPSMLINTNNTAKCFTCGFYGDSISFFQKANDIDFIRAVNWINRK